MRSCEVTTVLPSGTRAYSTVALEAYQVIVRSLTTVVHPVPFQA